MFNNRFNSTKKDPLVEAVQIAMQDGEIRRQAEALVNEEFGVFNRRAVVREQLAAYDARLEEAYKCMKEGKPNDGNLANNYPPYDKVTRGDVIAGATGKDQMGGKKKKMEEEQIDEVSKKTLASYIKKAASEKPYTSIHGAAYDAASGDPKARKTIQKRKQGIERATDRLTKEETQIAERNLLKRMKDTMRLGSSGKERVDRISSALSDRGGNWDFKKGDFTEKGKSQVKSRLKNVKGASDYALNKEETQMDEAAYSAKAARAGKDIGKPGKEFKRIAKSAAARYGSEERGKKVAGAILKRIRAKHMKEEQISEIVVQKSQMRPGETLGQAMNRLTGKTAIRGGANDPSSAKFKGPATATAAGQLAKSGIANMSTGGGAMRTLPSNLDSFQKGISQEKDKTAADSAVRGIRNRNPETKEIDPTKFLYPGAASAAGRATSVSSEPATSSASSMPAEPKPAATAAAAPSMSMSDPKAQKLKESVQVGVNKYRIV